MRHVYAGFIAIFMLASIIYAQKPVQTQPAKISTDPLIVALRKVAAAAEERTPFASISAAGSALKTTAPKLPGSSACVLGFTPARDVPAFVSSYVCSWKMPDDRGAAATYEQLIEKVLRSGDWIAKPFQGVPSLQDAAYNTSIGVCARLEISRPEKQVVKVLVAAACPAAKRSVATAESSPPLQAKTPSQQMSMGVLAVVSDHEGVLFIDGEQKTTLVPDKVFTLNLTAGQHFVDLRDAKGSRLWEKIATIPAGTQVAERVQLNAQGNPPKTPISTQLYFGGSAPPQADVNGNQQSLPFILNGEWLCESGSPGTPCQTATVSVSGSQFSLRFESHPELRGQSCDAVMFPPAPDRAYSCYFNVNGTGTVDGSTIEGVLSMTNSPPDSRGCGFPSESHRFNASIKENGQVLAITTEENMNTYHWHDAKQWVWQKPQLVCDPVTVDRTQPVMFTLRSKAFNRPSVPLVPIVANPAAYAPNSYIGSQIDEVIKSGRYTALPPAQATGGTVGQQPGLSIENQTAYELTILMTGPVERSFSISSGTSQVVAVPPGNYRVVGKVNAPDVLPFFGPRDYASGTSYRESFYIK